MHQTKLKALSIFQIGGVCGGEGGATALTCPPILFGRLYLCLVVSIINHTAH